MSYTFTANWFMNSELKHIGYRFIDPNRANSILEIGSFEGQSAIFFMDHFMDHPESSLVCVDPFSDFDETTTIPADTKNIFYKNISSHRNFSKVKVYESFSDRFFDKMHRLREAPKYDFVYIDGSHLLADITVDLNYSIRMTRRGGIIWMDDYGAGHLGITEHVNRMYEHNKEDLDIIHRGWQIAFRKK